MGDGKRGREAGRVGRERELTDLEDALLAAIGGEGRMMLLAGDAGMGKTRLATELGERARGIGAIVLAGGCSEADLALPYLPFLEALGNYVAQVDLKALRQRLGGSAAQDDRPGGVRRPGRGHCGRSRGGIPRVGTASARRAERHAAHHVRSGVR